ncbi:MAG: IS30 family transposase [Chlamydiota bacterium]
MKTNYKRLAREQRYLIEIDLKSGLSIRTIAHRLKISPSTVSREVNRNSGKRGYRHNQAQSKANLRKTSKIRQRKLTASLLRKVNALIKEDMSPKQISGRLKLLEDIDISHETIYRHIWEDKKQGGSLYFHLRRKAKKYNKRSTSSAGRGKIPNRVDISKRPKIVEKKKQIGHFEGDLIVGKDHKGAILTLVERATKVSFLFKLKNKEAKAVTKGIIKILKRFKGIIKTITFDNGKEFSLHEKVSKSLGIKCYFATPYHSWERGLNEHHNGLIRQYIPKKTDFSLVTKKYLIKIQNKLNNRPREVLGFKTPREVFLLRTGLDVTVALAA